jgi:hypothetical protein
MEDASSDIDIDMDLDARVLSSPPLPPRVPIRIVIDDSDDDANTGNPNHLVVVPVQEEDAYATNSQSDDDSMEPIIVNGVLLYDPTDERTIAADITAGQHNLERHKRDLAKGDVADALFNPLQPLRSYIEEARVARRGWELRDAVKKARAYLNGKK